MISLGGGLPADDMFPFSELSVKLKDGSSIKLSDDTLKQALQYSSSYGMDPLVAQLKSHIDRVHKPAYKDWNVMVTVGSQDALTKAFSMLINPGDTILTENPTYSGSLAALRPMGANIVGIDIDSNGLIPQKLRETLQSFKKYYPNHRTPKVLYTIPTGQNPSGTTQNNARRKEIYDIACEYDLIILEDDPYWDLRLLPYKKESAEGQEKLKSYFSMDTDQRVIRFDSFSKIISSGVRIGWATGPLPFIENMQLHAQATTLQPSGISQAIVHDLLVKWGPQGFEDHISKVQKYYSFKRDAFVGAAENHLRGLCEWNIPEAGMFAWMKVRGVEDTENLIKNRAVAALVLLLPGRVFSTEDKPSPYVRASFSLATTEEINTALERFAKLLKEK
eukprot:TRINITY_DN3121_c0_g1_i1.p1 TRINITY_DN3121_c0_g1~~TRINITY_DN3121_c0_g1_i1.p1  ORF type:complete len:391 (+),score=56.55 TRINITY_DN3121_c0_g1_i1:238-1410(+)